MTLVIDGRLALARNDADAGHMTPHDFLNFRTWHWQRPGEDAPRLYLTIDAAVFSAETTIQKETPMTRLTIEGALSLARGGADVGRLLPDVDSFGLRTWRWERPEDPRPRRYLRLDHALADAEAGLPSSPPDCPNALFAYGAWCLVAGQTTGATFLRPLSSRISGYPSAYLVSNSARPSLLALRADGGCVGIAWDFGSKFKTRAGNGKAIAETKSLAGALPRLIAAALPPKSAHDRLAAAELARQIRAWIKTPSAPETSW